MADPHSRKQASVMSAPTNFCPCSSSATSSHRILVVDILAVCTPHVLLLIACLWIMHLSPLEEHPDAAEEERRWCGHGESFT